MQPEEIYRRCSLLVVCCVGGWVSGLPTNIPAHTVAQACISSNVGIATAAEKILSGQASTVLVGGVETFSDVPIRLTRPLRQVGGAEAEERGRGGGEGPGGCWRMQTREPA